MKFFEILDSPELRYAPQLKNWYGKFDVRDIRINAFHRVPDMQVFMIEPSLNTIYTDLILFPFLLVSPRVKEVIKMYRERCYFRKVILMDQEHRESRLYYLPALDETSDIQLRKIRYTNGVGIPDTPDVKGEKIKLDRNLFWVRDTKKRHIILSLDMAESLIRRGITGLGLCEVQLYGKN